jgi:hypothetical protein
MFKKYIKIILPVLVVLLMMNFIVGPEAKAGFLSEEVDRQLLGLQEVGLPGEMENPADPIVNLIRMFLGVLALVFLILVLYAGFKWMTSAGNSETIDKAKKIMTSALVGLLIIFLSYAITAFIFNVVLSSRGMFDWR